MDSFCLSSHYIPTVGQVEFLNSKIDHDTLSRNISRFCKNREVESYGELLLVCNNPRGVRWYRGVLKKNVIKIFTDKGIHPHAWQSPRALQRWGVRV